MLKVSPTIVERTATQIAIVKPIVSPPFRSVVIRSKIIHHFKWIYRAKKYYLLEFHKYLRAFLHLQTMV